MAHYYDNEGNPRHFEGKNGKGTTLREARKLDLYPSVTTVLNVIAKPQLVNWLQDQAALEALQADQSEIQDNADNLLPLAKRMVRQAREKTFAKADEGSAIHDALEIYFSGGLAHVIGDYMPMCDRVNALLLEHCGDQVWVPEQSFCNTRIGYAGKCDLHSPNWVIDFKSKDGSVENAKGYPDQADQLAAYAHGLGVPGARRANVFISRDDGSVSFYEHTDENAWNRFEAALNCWQVRNKFGPMYERKAA